MKAMILAAGIGSRLQPLTNKLPKALVPVNGLPLIQYTIDRLKAVGVGEIIINTYHFTEQIVDYITRNNSFGIHIEFSHEKELLDTGGGLKAVSSFFKGEKSFILHNVDIISEINLQHLVTTHNQSERIATLAVRKRKTSRMLLFDHKMCLVGWKSIDKNQIRILQSADLYSTQSFAFLGIHIISPKIFDHFPEEDKFSIIDAYLHIAENQGSIYGLEMDSGFWFDVGKPESIQEAEKFIRNH